MTNTSLFDRNVWQRIGACLVPLVFAVCAAYAAEPRVQRAVVYGEAGGEKLLLDVYQPAEPASKRIKHPSVLLIHGGGWEGGTRTSSMLELANTLANAGYVVFNTDYRLVKDSPDGETIINTYPAAIEDCRRAVQWVRRNAERYGVDTEKIGAYGESAGGHLVSLLGTTDVRGADAELAPFSSRVQAVVNVFGPGDLTQDFSKFEIFGRTVQDLVDRLVGEGNIKGQQAASPIRYIDDRTAPFLFLHGTVDPLVPIAQSRMFHAALRQAGRESELVELPGEGHGFSKDAQKIAIVKTIAFFDRNLKSGAPRSAGEDEPSADAKPVADAEPTAKPAATDWGALFKMHYQSRVKMFADQNRLIQNVVLVGDSITEGFDIETYFPGRRILNRGIGADVIGNGMGKDDPRGVLQRLDSSIFNCAATDVFLLIGINDLNSGRTPDIMEDGYRELFQRIKEGAPRVRVHVQSVLPTSGAHAGRNPAVLDTNQRLKRMAAEFKFNFIDLHSLMANREGQLKQEFTEDGLHLTAPAYVVWKAEVLRALGWTDSQP